MSLIAFLLLGAAASVGAYPSIHGFDYRSVWTSSIQGAEIEEMVPVSMFPWGGYREGTIVSIALWVPPFDGSDEYPRGFRPWDSRENVIEGLTCPGVPNVTLREPASHHTDGRLPLGNYTSRGTSRAYVCWHRCRVTSVPPCPENEEYLRVASTCVCKSRDCMGSPANDTPAHPGMLQPFLTAELVVEGTADGNPEWRIRSAAPARITGSEFMGLRVDTYMPAWFAEKRARYKMTGLRPSGHAETTERFLFVYLNPSPSCPVAFPCPACQCPGCPGCPDSGCPECRCPDPDPRPPMGLSRGDWGAISAVGWIGLGMFITMSALLGFACRAKRELDSPPPPPPPPPPTEDPEEEDDLLDPTDRSVASEDEDFALK